MESRDRTRPWTKASVARRIEAAGTGCSLSACPEDAERRAGESEARRPQLARWLGTRVFGTDRHGMGDVIKVILAFVASGSPKDSAGGKQRRDKVEVLRP